MAAGPPKYPTKHLQASDKNIKIEEGHASDSLCTSCLVFFSVVSVTLPTGQRSIHGPAVNVPSIMIGINTYHLACAEGSALQCCSFVSGLCRS